MNYSLSTMTGKTKIKIVFLGSQSVGKSSIIDKYIHNRFEQTANPTVGIDFLAKNISHKSKNYRLQLWDTAGQQRFRSLIPSYLKDANCALIVFDVTSKNSFAEVESWINLFDENKGGEGFIFLIGNKIDLEYREVTKKQAKQKAIKLGTSYIQISAKTGQHVQEIFLKVIEFCSQRNTNATNFLLENKLGIKQQEQIKQEETQVKQSVEQSKRKLQNNEQQLGIVPGNNVVLKNQKVQKPQRKGMCC